MTKRDVKLDQEEKELLASYERDEWQSVGDQESEIKRYQDYAHTTFKKEMRVNIRMSKQDLQALKKRAIEEGIPYQTLMASILHKYVTGRLIENNP